MKELKPCPFCGNEPYITNFDVFGGVRYVVCKSCGARMQGVDKSKAITAWNNRTPLEITLALAEVERLNTEKAEQATKLINDMQEYKHKYHAELARAEKAEAELKQAQKRIDRQNNTIAYLNSMETQGFNW